MPGDASVIRLNTPDGGLQACLTLGRVPKELADFMKDGLGIDTLSDLISYVKFDAWEAEVESKVIAVAIAAKAIMAETQNISLARLRAAWKAGWEAIKSSGARGGGASGSGPCLDNEDRAADSQQNGGAAASGLPSRRGPGKCIGRHRSGMGHDSHHLPVYNVNSYS